MSIRLSDDEAWAAIDRAHTGILTTLRRDGRPVALPIWHVVRDRCVYVGTPARSKKVARVRNDDRASFLVESGEAWVELTAVHLPVRAQVLDARTDADEIADVGRLFAEKYADFQPRQARVPEATTEHYGSRAWLRLEPDGKPLTWDNSRIRLRVEGDDRGSGTKA